MEKGKLQPVQDHKRTSDPLDIFHIGKDSRDEIDPKPPGIISTLPNDATNIFVHQFNLGRGALEA